MLAELAERVKKVNNRNKTLVWGSHLSHNTLVLVCGHPSVEAIKHKKVCFVCTYSSDIVIEVEVVDERYASAYVSDVDSAIDYIIKILKEVYEV